MSNVRRFRTEEPTSSAASTAQVASWYTQGRSDGLGDRLLMFDNTNAASLELLRFRSAFAAAPDFELALRARVAQLARFNHPGFPAVRAVEHLDDGSGLALVSTHVPGRRLSEMFQSPQPRAGLHPAFVTWLIRQLTTSLAALQAQGEKVVHGAMSADRVIVGADGHLLIAEHVLGSALDNLRLTPNILSNEFGVLAPPTKTGLARIDARTDVIQLGLIALAVLLGRQITYDTYQQDLRPLIDEFSASAKQRSPFLAPALRLWLERALQLDKYSFGSAAEARDGLKELPNTASPHESATGQSSVLVDRPGGDALTHIRSSSRSGGSNASVPPAAAAPAATRGSAPVAFQASTGPRLTAPVIPRVTSQTATRATRPLEPVPVPPETRRGSIETQEYSPSDRPPVAARSSPPVGRAHRPGPTPVPSPSVAEAGFVRSDVARPGRSLRDIGLDPEFPDPDPAPVGRRTIGGSLTVALAVVALVEAGLLGRFFLSGQDAAAPPQAIPVLIDSLHPGDLVIVDGRPVGTTPMTVQVEAQTGSIRVAPSDNQTRETTANRPTESREPVVRDQRSGRPVPAAGTGFGEIRLVTPIPLQVFENERFVGSSGAGPVSATTGVHDLELVNTELGYRTYQRVTVLEGKVVPLTVTPPLGHVNITAVPAAQVWIDGRPAGETPLGNVTLPAGPHTITFRHPELGERIESIMVRPAGETQVSATFR